VAFATVYQVTYLYPTVCYIVFGVNTVSYVIYL